MTPADLPSPSIDAAAEGTVETGQDVAAPSMMRRLRSPRTVISFTIAVAIVAVALWHANIDWSDLWSRMRHADKRLYIGAIAAYYLSFVVRGLRWQVLLRNAGEDCRLVDLTEIIVVSFFVNCIVPAKMGDVYRAVLVRQREHIGATKAFGTIIAERLVDLLVLMSLLVIAGAITFKQRVPGDLVPYAISGSLLAAVGIALFTAMRLGRGQRLLRRLPAQIVERYESFRAGTVHSMGRWREVLPLSVAVWGLEATRLGLIVASLGLTGLLGPAQFLLVALVAALATTVPFTPGGLGFVELVVAGVLVKVADVSQSAAFSIALLDRSVSYGTLVILGFVVFTFAHVRVARPRIAAESSA